MRFRWLRRGLFAVVVVVVVAAVLQLVGLVPQLNPFGVETVDRSQPAVLKAVRDLSQYHAASGDYQVVLDIEQDVKYVPAVLAGERSLFVAAGSVNAYVDLGRLLENSLTVSADGKSVAVALPDPVLDKPNLDNQRSYLFSQKRGLLNRLSAIVDVPRQQSFYVAAEQRIATAAKASGLVDRARRNTQLMLDGLLRTLGFQVEFVPREQPK